MQRIICVSQIASSCPDAIDSLLGSIKETVAGMKTRGSIIVIGRVCFQIIEGDTENVITILELLNQHPCVEEVNVLDTSDDISEWSYSEWSLTKLADTKESCLDKSIAKLFAEFLHAGKVLARYTQPRILEMMRAGQDPLQVISVERNRIILFSDIVSFSLLTTQVDKQELWTLVDIYFNACTKIIMEHGGEVNKFIGDCVMAYFPEERADDALQAALDILSDIAGFRGLELAESPIQLLHCGIAMSFGSVIEGNIGRYKKMDYTIQGDPVNKAAYMEKLTRDLPRLLVFTEEVKNIMLQDWPFIHLGDFPLKPDRKKTPIYSLDHPATLKKVKKQELNKIIIDRYHSSLTR